MVPMKLNLLCTVLTGFQLLFPGDEYRGRKGKRRNTSDLSESSRHDALFSTFFLMVLAISIEWLFFQGCQAVWALGKQRKDCFSYKFYSTIDVIKTRKVFIMPIYTYMTIAYLLYSTILKTMKFHNHTYFPRAFLIWKLNKQ